MRSGGGAPDTPGWTVRVVPNLYPALTADSPEPKPEARPELFTAMPATGAHEVIVNAPDPVVSLSQLEVGAGRRGRRRLARAHARAHRGGRRTTCT